jgi:hypothetical protein
MTGKRSASSAMEMLSGSHIGRLLISRIRAYILEALALQMLGDNDPVSYLTLGNWLSLSLSSIVGDPPEPHYCFGLDVDNLEATLIRCDGAAICVRIIAQAPEEQNSLPSIQIEYSPPT